MTSNPHREGRFIYRGEIVNDEISGAIKEETGPAAVRRVSPGLLDARPVHALGAPGIVVVSSFTPPPLSGGDWI